MLKRTGRPIVFLIFGLFGLAATIDVGSALPIAQSDHGGARGATRKSRSAPPRPSAPMILLGLREGEGEASSPAKSAG